MTDTTPSPAEHDLKLVKVKLADLAHFEGNARRGDVEAIAQSLEELGQFRTIVVNKGTHTGRPNEILAGNHTVQAAAHLGWATIKVSFVDVDDTVAKKIVLADNRTNDLATYDDTALAELLEGLGDGNLAGTGYTVEDYDDLIDSTLLPPPINTGGTGVGTGKRVTVDALEWGFAQWKTTRTQITVDEVALLDREFEAYVDSYGSGAGFGHHIAKALATTGLAGVGTPNAFRPADWVAPVKPAPAIEDPETVVDLDDSPVTAPKFSDSKLQEGQKP